MSENLVPNMLTPVSCADMMAALSSAWQTLFRELPSRESVVLLGAHWAHETGVGKSCHVYNIGNIKHVPGDGHDYCQFRCWELVKGEKKWYDPPSPATSFRAYSSLADGCADYLATLRRRFGRAWPFVLSGDVPGFCKALKAQGYYTALESEYEAAMLARAQLFRGIPYDIKPEPIDDATRARVLAMVSQSLSSLAFADPVEPEADA